MRYPQVLRGYSYLFDLTICKPGIARAQLGAAVKLRRPRFWASIDNSGSEQDHPFAVERGSVECNPKYRMYRRRTPITSVLPMLQYLQRLHFPGPLNLVVRRSLPNLPTLVVVLRFPPDSHHVSRATISLIHPPSSPPTHTDTHTYTHLRGLTLDATSRWTRMVRTCHSVHHIRSPGLVGLEMVPRVL